MNPRIASLVFWCGIGGLLYLNRDRNAKTSPYLWLAAAWIFIGASRMLSQWLGAGFATERLDTPDQYLEGSPLDRAFLTALQVAGMAVLVARGRQVGKFLRANRWLVLFFVYCAISVIWSDFPFVAWKRWIKVTGNVTMLLVVLTDDDPTAAIKRVFSRTGFLLITLSVLFVKYYPELSRGYVHWTWTPFETGVSIDKNGLGALCLIFGLASLWRFVEAWRDKTMPRRKGVLTAHGIVLAMMAYLLHMAKSSTSLSCFILGSIVILVTTGKRKAHPRTAYFVAGGVAVLGLLAYVFNDAYTFLVQSVGRDTTLTGRTDIWNDVLNLKLNPLIGTGYESFWLGARAEYFWQKYPFHPNQAHNGYIETYLNLGWIGVGLLAMLIGSGLRNSAEAFRQNFPWATLKLSFLIVSAVYNITEGAFKVMQPVYIAFLFAVMAVPASNVKQESPPIGEASTEELSPVGWFGEEYAASQDGGSSEAIA